MSSLHQGQEVARRFFAGTSSSYDEVVKITTFGRDAVWKRAIADLIPSGSYSVLDLACGTGVLSFQIAKKVSRVIGIDIIEDSIRIAREKALVHNASNVSFYVCAAEAIPQASSEFDFVTASYLPKYCDIDTVVSEVCRVLKPGGMLIMHDFTYPNASIIRGLWNAYFRILRIAGVFAPSWRPVFNELDDVIRNSDWLDDLVMAMKRHGFSDIRSRSLTLGTAAVVYGRYGN